MRYQKTIFLIHADGINGGIKPGQWVADSTGIRGQYLGKTRAGTIVIRWQNGKFGSRADTRSNHLLREFAKVNGSR
jgi:hypothetical protein